MMEEIALCLGQKIQAALMLMWVLGFFAAPEEFAVS